MSSNIPISEAVSLALRSWWSVLLLLFAGTILVACNSTPELPATDAPPGAMTADAAASQIVTTVEVAPSGAASGDSQQRADRSPSDTPLLVASSGRPNPYGPPSLDERIFFPDAIAIVRPVSAEPGAIAVLNQGPEGRTYYSPMVLSRLEVIEYVKGEGESEITVEATSLYTYDSDLKVSAEEALNVAETNRAAQSSGIEGVAGIVFLRQSEYPDGTADSREAASEAQWRQFGPHLEIFAAVGDVGDSSATFRISTEKTDGQVEGFSIAHLRERIEAMKSLLREGEGIEGWEECIGKTLSHGNYLRKYRATHGEDPPNTVALDPLPSGQPSGFTIHSGDLTGGRGYDKNWLTGEDARYFEILIVEEGHVITPDFWATRDEMTAYDIDIRALRPLPAGLYEFYGHGQRPEEIPCDFTQEAVKWNLTLESSEGVLHEAFFDPLDIGDEVGADAENGVLGPYTFETGDGSQVEIRRIDWQGGQVSLELSLSVELADHRIDFIVLDGSISLRLDFTTATKTNSDGAVTLTWGVCEQPWEEGDLLMLRIAEGIPEDGVVATNDSDCQAASRE